MAEAQAVQSEAIPVPTGQILLTEKAAEMVKQAMAQEGLAGHGLRVGVIGGGCSGLQYMLDFSKEPVEDDFVFEQHGVTVYLDPFSAAHLNGTTINYVDSLQGAGFKFDNPNVQRSCGCGSSFS